MSTHSHPEHPPDVALERHLTIGEIAERFHVSYKTAQHLFENEPGVLKIVSQGTINKRKYTTLRVPESVVVRVHRGLRAG